MQQKKGGGGGVKKALLGVLVLAAASAAGLAVRGNNPVPWYWAVLEQQSVCSPVLLIAMTGLYGTIWQQGSHAVQVATRTESDRSGH